MADNDSSTGMIVGIVAIVAILIVGYFAVQMLQKNSGTPTQQPGVNLNINGGSAGSAGY